MSHCDGSPAFVQADCGATGPHPEHPCSDANPFCPGAPAGFEADCGQPGPHTDHPYSQPAKVTR